MSDQRLFPMLAYADARAAIEHLRCAFGFEELTRYEMPDGRIGHAELSHEGTVIMLADEYPELGLESPRSAPAASSQIFLRVSDVEAHYARAKAGGAVVVGQPAVDHGDCSYRAMDCEGHRWIFAGPDPNPTAAEEDP